MSSPSHQLSTTGRLLANFVAAVFIFAAFSLMPSFDYQWLFALLVLAALTTWSATLALSLPAPRAKKSTVVNNGSIKWFNSTKGFGFITGENGDEVFVHFRNVEGLGKRAIKPGQRVSYRVVASDKGPQAEDVKPL